MVFDFGQNYAGACELTLAGPTSPLKGLTIDLRYGEALLGGSDGHRDVFHPWWPCTGVTPGAEEGSHHSHHRSTNVVRAHSATQGAHNCANQTDRYVVRGAPGAVGPVAALGKVPMRSHHVEDAPVHAHDCVYESYTPSHSLKGGRWVQVNGTAVSKSLRFALNVKTTESGDLCVPTSGVGFLTPCTAPRGPDDVVLSLRMWPIHSDVPMRGGVKLYPMPPQPRPARNRNESDSAHRRRETVTLHGSPTPSSSQPLSVTAPGWSVDNINALQTSIVRTHLNNLHSIPTDCPHRERRGWGGDAQVTAGSAALNFDMGSFYRNWLTTMQDIQVSNGHGDLPSYVPRSPDHGDHAPTWAAIAMVVPWEYTTQTDDDSLVDLGLNTSMSLMGYWQQNLDTDGLLNIYTYVRERMHIELLSSSTS